MGVAITRKAILGGICVDTKEDLKNSINFIDVYLGIAGVSYGLQNCPTFLKVNLKKLKFILKL